MTARSKINRSRSSNYRKGRDAEYHWRDTLEPLVNRKGQRSAGSKSPADLLFIPENSALFVVWRGGESFLMAWGDEWRRGEPVPQIWGFPLSDLQSSKWRDAFRRHPVVFQCKNTAAEARSAAEKWARGETWKEWRKEAKLG